MNHGDSKTSLKQQEKQKMLDELESLSRMLDENLDDEDDTPSRPVPEDIPVLKSFVDDVPVLNERFLDEEPEIIAPPPKPKPAQKTDSVDQSAARFNTAPAPDFSGLLDDSFLDNDPLEISAAVRQHKPVPEPPLMREALQLDPEPVRPAAPVANARPAQAEAPAPQPRTSAPVPPPVTARTAVPEPQAARPEPVRPPAAPAATTKPAVSAPLPSASQAVSAPAPAAAPVPHTAASITQPLNRFQTSSKNENPFLPKSTLDKIRENHQQYDASAELRKLLQNNPLNKLSFDASAASKEYQALRQKASQLVNEVIRANMPRMEAELRMKLEQEVDRMFKEIRKK